MPGALENIRVLDMTIWQQGTSASAMLADLGADVVKIEEPTSGDPGRYLGRVQYADNMSGYFQALNRGKRSVAIDLKCDKGRDVLLRLTRDADVFLTNFRLGVADRLGVGYEAVAGVNPRIIYVQASGYGPEGPEAETGSYDILGQARGGLMAVTGDPEGPPKPAGFPLADQAGGVMTAFGILAALLHRGRTGEGQRLDTSLLGTMMSLQSFNMTSYFLSGGLPRRVPRAGLTPFWNVYRGSDDRWFAIGMLREHGWPQICDAIGRPELAEDERFATFEARAFTMTQEIMAILDEAFAERPADEWVRELEARGVHSARVQDYQEISQDPQALANDYLVEVERADGPPVRMVATPVHLSKTPAHIRGIAPELGAHTEEVLLEGGYTWDEISELRDEGAVGLKDDSAEDR